MADSNNIPRLTVYSAQDFYDWLEENADTESRVMLVLYKKHTDKPSPTHRELLDEAICFGWIDTTIKRIDEDRYIRHFTRRTKNGNWSDNTLSYAKKLEEQGRLKPYGKKMYKVGKKKPTLDNGIPKNPTMPDELKKALEKNPKAKAALKAFPPSTKRMFYRWLLGAKLPETRQKRVKVIIKNALKGNKSIF